MNKIRYLSLFSGIEAFSCAVKDMPEFEPVAFAEIEPFPCAVLQHHFPDVPNLGDVTQIDGRELRGLVDLIVGGSPCQGFSVAGQRKGLDDERSCLALTYVRLVDEVRPKMWLWENVPGCLSTNGGQDLRSFLSALADIGYSLSWTVLDSQYFGVAQRRRRVFAFGYFGDDWQSAAKVLLEPESMCRNPPPRRKKREGDSGRAEGGAGERGKQIAQNPTFATLCASGAGCDRPSAQGSQLDYLVLDEPKVHTMLLGHTKANGANVGEDVAYTVDAAAPQAIAFADSTEREMDSGRDVYPIQTQNALHNSDVPAGGIGIGKKDGPTQTMRGDGKPPAVGIIDEVMLLHDNNGNTHTLAVDTSPTLTTQQDKHAWCLAVKEEPKYVVRRITPVEAERLQGFPDGWTDVEFKGKPAPDTARYRALGNSFTVDVVRWIARRILMVEKGEL